MTDQFDPRETEAALELDAQIDALLAGRVTAATDPTLLALASTVRTDPPSRLGPVVAATIGKAARRRLAPVRVVAAFMAYLFLSHGIGNLVDSGWIARNLGEVDSPHFATEGGFALIAVGLVVAAAAVRVRWLPIAVLAAVPLGLAFGVLGVREVDEFAAGAVLHLSQLAAALGLGAMYWRMRRYVSAVRDEPQA